MSAKQSRQSLYTIQNKIELIKGGSDYFSLLQKLISGAQHSIYIRIYIWNNDKTGNIIAELLIEAAKRNVAVFVIVDGYASQGLPAAFIKRIEDAGVHFRFFEPLLRSSNFYFGRRMHEKVVVIDGRFATVAGINFADRYNDVDDIPAWLDFALFIEGEAAMELHKICAADWRNKPVSIPVTQFQYFKENYSVRVRQNDWVKRKHNIWKTYFTWFNQSQETITIMCSYFLPGRILLNRLSTASKRGVKIKVILAGPSDIMLAKNAERYLYRWMIRNRIEIYEYQKTVLHAKMTVVDSRLVTIGSYNINNISTYASTELNLDIRNRQFGITVHQLMENIIEKDCERIWGKSPIVRAGIWKQFVQTFCYYLFRIILNVSTFYFKRE